MLSESIETHLDDISDHIDAIIFPTDNGYENAMQFNLVKAQHQLKAYLNSEHYAHTIERIRQLGVTVELIQTTSMQTEPSPNELSVFVSQCVDPATLYLSAAPLNEALTNYFLFSYQGDHDFLYLHDAAELAETIQHQAKEYKKLIENKKLITKELNIIQFYITQSMLWENTNPFLLDLTKLAGLITAFNQCWGVLLPLEFKLSIKNGKAYASLTGNNISSTRDLPELRPFSMGAAVNVDLLSIPDADNSTIIISGSASQAPQKSYLSMLGKCGLFSTAVAGVALAGAMVGVQMGKLF